MADSIRDRAERLRLSAVMILSYPDKVTPKVAMMLRDAFEVSQELLRRMHQNGECDLVSENTPKDTTPTPL